MYRCTFGPKCQVSYKFEVKNAPEANAKEVTIQVAVDGKHNHEMAELSRTQRTRRQQFALQNSNRLEISGNEADNDLSESEIDKRWGTPEDYESKAIQITLGLRTLKQYMC